MSLYLSICMYDVLQRYLLYVSLGLNRFELNLFDLVQGTRSQLVTYVSVDTSSGIERLVA